VELLQLSTAYRSPAVGWANATAVRQIRREKYDVIFTAAYEGLLLPRGTAGTIVYDLVDDHADGYRQAGQQATAEGVERFIRSQIDAADRVTVSGRVLQEIVRKNYGRDAVYAPNGARMEAVRAAGPPTPGADRRVGYMGGLDHFVDIRMLVGAIVKLRDAGKLVELVVIGDGPAVHGWPVPEWVRLCGFVTPQEVPGLMREFRVGTVPFKLSPFTDAALPLKVVEYGSARMRVVSTPLRELALQQLPWVDLVPPDAGRWATALDTALAGSWPHGADGVVESFDWGRTAETLLAVFRGEPAGS
jgi:glycosyltransferase involved in cell wall biosynthesis